MGTCDGCGEIVDHAFPCQRCGNSYCGDHRLPENHNCPFFVTAETPLTGDGPQTRDRRGTGRKRRERVQQKETKRWMNKTDDLTPQQPSGDTAVLHCPNCNEDVSQLKNCSECSDSFCPSCVSPQNHKPCSDGSEEDRHSIESSPDTGSNDHFAYWEIIGLPAATLVIYTLRVIQQPALAPNYESFSLFIAGAAGGLVGTLILVVFLYLGLRTVWRAV